MGADIDKDEDSFTKGGDLGYILLPLRGTDMDGGDTISRALQFGFLLPILGADVDKDGMFFFPERYQEICSVAPSGH